MKLETFLTHLHFDTEKIVPHDWKVNWEDAPLPYKLYRDLPEFPLSTDIPLTLEGRKASQHPTLVEVGHLLWYVYGITQYAQTAFMSGTEKSAVITGQSLRRYIPSGGALYPSEVYLYLKLTEIPEGIYHYSAAHHRLALIREGNYDSYLSQCLGNALEISKSFATIFVTTVFWKNFYKYHNFSYRLQGLDAGVVIGQTMEAANRFGFFSQICFQFLDRPVNHLLGVSEQEECVYAVIPLTIEGIVSQYENEKTPSVSSSSLQRELPERNPASYQRSKNVIDYPILRQLTEASMFENTDQFVKIDSELNNFFSSGIETIILPFEEPQSFDFGAVCRERHSPDIDFQLKKVTHTQISRLLKETMTFEYKNDLLGADEDTESRVDLYGCFYHVEGIPNGAYYYDKKSHSLLKISSGDYRGYLQDGLIMDNVNLYQVPLCFHIVGNRDHHLSKMGYRGYRVQQMEAGILLQRLLLTAGGLGLGGHPLLGFNAKSSDALYQLESKEKTCLIQIPVGYYQPRAWLTGNMY